MGVMEVKGEVT